MSKARSNFFVFTDKRLMKKTVGNLTDPSHSASGSNRLWHAFAGLILAGLFAWFMTIEGVAGWSYLCFMALLICCFAVSAIRTYACLSLSASGSLPCLVSFKLRSSYKERDLTINALKYYDPDFTIDIDFQIANYCN
jgi:hypothetical protein